MNYQAEKARVFSADASLQSLRQCSIRWLKEEWLQSMLWRYVAEINQQSFQVDVLNRAEIQFVEYSSKDSGHYDWHHDVQWYGQSTLDRKLSVTVQLSDASAYEGGDFEFEEVHTTANFRSKGSVLVFPSYLRHKIHPVTTGTRRALVAWFYGPRWR